MEIYDFEEAENSGTNHLKTLPVGEEMSAKGYNLCREFLGGAWARCSSNEFHIKEIRGGMSNIVYLCYLSRSVQLQPHEQRQVLVRIYGQIIKDNPETVVTDSVIYALLAERKLGPKLYGVFTGGRIEEYVHHRKLSVYDLRKPDISMSCADIMARFHHLSMPIVKEARWLFDTIDAYLRKALKVSFPEEDAESNRKLQKALGYQLPKELHNLKRLVNQVSSPVVFCHNDLQEGNILYVGEEDGFQLIPIDFEYASYNYRGFDIANHFCEWCYNYDIEDRPGYTSELDHFPTEQQQLVFIRTYLDCCASSAGISDLERLHEEEQLLDEVKVFTLVSDYMWAVWAIVQSHMSTIHFGYLDYALSRLEAYSVHKKLLLNTKYSMKA